MNDKKTDPILIELSINMKHVIEKVDKLDDITDILDKTISYFQVEHAVLKTRVDEFEKNKEICKKEVYDYARSEDEKIMLKTRNWVLVGLSAAMLAPAGIIVKEIIQKVKP